MALEPGLTIPRAALLGRAGLCLLFACLGGCGSPGGPSAVPPWVAAGTVLTFTSGETSQPVSGATVGLAADTYVTDAGGRVVLRKPIAAATEATLAVRHSAYLERTTSLRDQTQTSFSLWPASSPTGVYPEYTQKLVYSNDAPPRGTLPLRRLPPGTTRVSVVPSPEIQADARAMEAHRVAVERMTMGTEFRVLYSLDATPTASVIIRTVVRPDDPCFPAAAACARNYSSGDQITGAEIVFPNIDWARHQTVPLHELGHTYGLGHSFSAGDIMGGPVLTFSPAEVLTMRLMWQRRAGNRWADDDRGVATTSSTGRHTEVISCDFGRR